MIQKTFPEENEIVLCTVKKVLYHTVFVTLDEYKDKEGIIHISEISPGRIRNIRDYVRENKKIICKILRVNKEKDHIDLSLRRVTISMRKNKLDELKQQQRAEKILEILEKQNKIPKTDIDEITKIGLKTHENLYSFFQESLTNPQLLETMPKKLQEPLKKIIQERIKLPEVKINSLLILQTNADNGIEEIKKALKKAEDFAKSKKQDLKILYISAPNYKLTLTSSDYKEAEETMKQIAEQAINYIKKIGYGEFIRNA